MERVGRNIDRLAEFGRAHKIGIRPHTKTHKSLTMAKLQLDAGAVGLTVAKPGEAEVMAPSGGDLLLAYPVVDPVGCRRVAELARKTPMRLAVDSWTAAERLSEAATAAGCTLGILIDIDVGLHRTGLQTPQQALELARLIDVAKGLRLDGLFCYPGHVWSRSDEQGQPLGQVAAILEEAIALFRSAGLPTGIVSGGSTPSAYQSNQLPQLTEIRPGTYIFNDMNTVAGGYCTQDDCAAEIVCTVVSDAVPGQIVIDAGSKTLTNDRCIPQPESGLGHIREFPSARISALSEEHGQVDVRNCDSAPRVGDRLTVVPNHICPCVNLQEMLWLQESDGSLKSSRVDARGRVS